jgi:hypothetical protein
MSHNVPLCSHKPYLLLDYWFSYEMSTKQKILNAISAHPKLVTFGIGLAITMAVGAAIGMFEVQQAHAIAAVSTVPMHSAFASAGGGGCAGCG